MMQTYKRSNDFIERSIMGAINLIKESVFSDECASQKGFLQMIDPRIKALTLLVFIVTVLFTKSISVCFVLYLICLALVCFSKINIIFFLKRTWIFIPLFSLFIAIPAVFSVFSPGETVFSFRMFGLGFVITKQGLLGASLFFMRVMVSVSFAVLLSITTKHFELLKVLRVFRVPQIFVMILGMCYRYIYLFIDIIENTYTAIKSRAGQSVQYKKGQHIVAWNAASLWHRSYQLNEAVYGAMLSRGYSGEPVTINEFKAGALDWAWLVFVVSVSAALIYLGDIWGSVIL